jgi:hypothetical protein
VTVLEDATLIDHDHVGVAGDGGAFDAANLLSGSATDGWVLTADGAGSAAWEAAPGGSLDASGVTDGYVPTADGADGWDWEAVPGGSAALATDTFWAAKGDLVVGTANDAAAILPVGTVDGYMLAVASGEATGLKWMNRFSVAAPASVAYQPPSAGTSIYAARIDHKHAAAASWSPAAHNLLSIYHGDTTSSTPDDGDVITWDDGSSKWIAAAPVATGGSLDATGVTADYVPTADGADGWDWAAQSGGGSASLATDALWAAKGDLAIGTANDAAAILSVGTNGQVLTADSAQTTGVKWATPSAGGGDTDVLQVQIFS